MFKQNTIAKCGNTEIPHFDTLTVGTKNCLSHGMILQHDRSKRVQTNHMSFGENTNRIYHYLKSSLLLTDSFYMFYSLKIFVVHCLLAIKPLLDLGTEIWIHLCHRKTNCKKEDPNISQHNYNHHARNHSSCAQTWSPRPLFPLISAVKEYPTPAT